MLDTGRCEILLQFLFIIYLFYYLLFLFMIFFFLPRHKNHVVISLKITFNEINVWGGGGEGARIYFRAHIHRRFRHDHHETRDRQPSLGSRGRGIIYFHAYSLSNVGSDMLLYDSKYEEKKKRKIMHYLSKTATLR